MISNKEKALQLRMSGHSVRDISSTLNRSISTIQYWVSGMPLSLHQRNIILKKTLHKKQSYYKQLKKKMFTRIKEIAQKNNGKCLSKKYINSKSPLEFKCVNGHKWEATPDNIKRGTWCPYCRNTDNIEEERCRYIFEWLTNYKFPKNRLILNNKQELDGYCKEINLAFEFNGIQHYKYVPFFHRNEANFSYQKIRDETKQKMCQSKKIRLVTISYNIIDIFSFIRDELLSLKINIRNDLEKFSFINLQKKSSKLFKCKNFAEAKNLKCLSTVFMDSKSKMKWECSKNHIWESSWNNIQRGSGCPECAKIFLRNKFKKYNIDDMRNLARTRNGDCLSTEYINCKTHLLWECSKKHHWHASPEKTIQGQWCSKCRKKNRVIST